MEVKTCEEYVLNKLTETEEELYNAQNLNNELQRILYTIQGCLELNEAEDGDLSISIDDYVYGDETLVNVLKQYLGRGKFEIAAAEDTDADDDAEENVEA